MATQARTTRITSAAALYEPAEGRDPGLLVLARVDEGLERAVDVLLALLLGVLDLALVLFAAAGLAHGGFQCAQLHSGQSSRPRRLVRTTAGRSESASSRATRSRMSVMSRCMLATLPLSSDTSRASGARVARISCSTVACIAAKSLLVACPASLSSATARAAMPPPAVLRTAVASARSTVRVVLTSRFMASLSEFVRSAAPPEQAQAVAGRDPEFVSLFEEHGMRSTVG